MSGTKRREQDPELGEGCGRHGEQYLLRGTVVLCFEEHEAGRYGILF